MQRTLLTACLVMTTACGYVNAKGAGNRPYIAAFEEQSSFYARCIPAATTGNEGTTQILRLRPEGDEVTATYAWYNRNGIVLAWSPKAGKVAVMRLRQDEGLPTEKQIEFSFYLGDQLLRSYTTTDLVKLGAKLERDWRAFEKDDSAPISERAAYRVEGCKQVPGSNDYYFSVRLDDAHTLSFDILTGELSKMEKAGKDVPRALDRQRPPLSAYDALNRAARYVTEKNIDVSAHEVTSVRYMETGSSPRSSLGQGPYWQVTYERVPHGLGGQHFIVVYTNGTIGAFGGR